MLVCESRPLEPIRLGKPASGRKPPATPQRNESSPLGACVGRNGKDASKIWVRKSVLSLTAQLH